MAESVYVHLWCFWYNTVFNNPLFSAKKKKSCFVGQKQIPLDRNTAKAQFCCCFLLKSKDRKEADMGGNTVVCENGTGWQVFR